MKIWHVKHATSDHIFVGGVCCLITHMGNVKIFSFSLSQCVGRDSGFFVWIKRYRFINIIKPRLQMQIWQLVYNSNYRPEQHKQGQEKNIT